MLAKLVSLARDGLMADLVWRAVRTGCRSCLVIAVTHYTFPDLINGAIKFLVDFLGG